MNISKAQYLIGKLAEITEAEPRTLGGMAHASGVSSGRIQGSDYGGATERMAAKARARENAQHAPAPAPTLRTPRRLGYIPGTNPALDARRAAKDAFLDKKIQIQHKDAPTASKWNDPTPHREKMAKLGYAHWAPPAHH